MGHGNFVALHAHGKRLLVKPMTPEIGKAPREARMFMKTQYVSQELGDLMGPENKINHSKTMRLLVL